MVWEISTTSGDYRIQNNRSSSYSGTYYNYFNINENGLIGINNSDPQYLLDVNGNTHIDGVIYASNIIGNVHNSANNILNINYEPGEINSNLLYVYGNTSFYGKIGIGIQNPTNTLDVLGKIKATEIEAVGSNITNINTSNITAGVLPVARGGTGIDAINFSQILFGGAINFEQNINLFWSSGENTLYAPNFKGNGKFITSLNATNITDGTLSVSRGGTGKNSYDIKGGILIGNFFGTNKYDISQSGLLTWNNDSNSFDVIGDIKLPSGNNIYIGDTPLKLDNFDTFPTASSNVKGMIKINPGDFIYNSDYQLSLATQGSSKWGKEDDSIFYPTGNVSQTHCVGIGTIPNTNYRLDINGDVNTSNGVFRINGVDVITNNSNSISNRLNNFTLDNIAQPPAIDNRTTNNGGWNNKFFTLRNTTLDNLASSKEFYISPAPDEYRFFIDSTLVISKNLEVKGTFDLQNPNAYTSISSMILERSHIESVLIVNQTGTGSIFNMKKSGLTQCRLNKDGNLGIGRSISLNFNEIIGNQSIQPVDSIEPVEKLHVIGNIISTGSITAFYSDERLKTFLSKIKNPLNIIENLNGYHYKPNELAVKNGFTDEPSIGLSAQDVQKVLPEIVKLAPFDTIRDNDGNITSKSGENYLTLSYEKLAPLFVEAIKELNKELKELKRENLELRKDIEYIKNIKNI